METIFIVFGFISTVWSGTMGYTFSLDIATVVMIAGFVFLIAFKRGAHHRRVSDAAVAQSLETYRFYGCDDEFNAKEERKLKADKDRWYEWTVERELRKEEQAERQKEAADW
jgi:hypothetical protein